MFSYSKRLSIPNPSISLFRYYDDEHYSENRSLHRSVSHPSLARSDSEFMEQWIAPADESDMSSQEGSPRMRRTQRVMVNNKYQIQ